MKESKEGQEIPMSKKQEEQAFLMLIKKDPMQIIKGMSSYDLKKPLVWRSRNKGMTLQQVATKHNITVQSVRTILKNIKNNS